MESKPVTSFVSNQENNSGSTQELTTSQRAEQILKLDTNTPSEAVIDTFMNRQIELSNKYDALNHGNFQRDATEMLDVHAQQVAVQNELDEVSQLWESFGGNDILDAQAAVDSLNFKSSAADLVAAEYRLRDAKNAFYENFSRVDESITPNASEASEPESTNSNSDKAPLARRAKPGVTDIISAKRESTEVTHKTGGPLPDIFTTPGYSEFVENFKKGKLGQTKTPTRERAVVATPSSNIEARNNWHNMMSAEREALAEAKTERKKALGSAATRDYLEDSVYVQEYRARRSKKRPLFGHVRNRFEAIKMEREFKKLQNKNARELAEFDQKASAEKATQAAKDATTLEHARREDTLLQRQLDEAKRMRAKLDAKHDRQNKRFQ